MDVNGGTGTVRFDRILRSEQGGAGGFIGAAKIDGVLTVTV